MRLVLVCPVERKMYMKNSSFRRVPTVEDSKEKAFIPCVVLNFHV